MLSRNTDKDVLTGNSVTSNRESFIQIPAWTPAMPTELFGGFPQPFQATAEIVRQSGPDRFRLHLFKLTY
jgi:hypothetical protein